MPAYTLSPAIVGHRLRYGVTALGASPTSFPATMQLALEPGCDISAKPQLINCDEELNGTRAAFDAPVTDGIVPINGRFSHKPRPDELTFLLQAAFGGTWSSTTLDPGSLLYFGFSFDRNVMLYNYVDCKIDQATLRASVGQALTMECQVEALTESIVASSSFPTLSLSTHQPFALHEAAFTLNGVTATPVNNIQITCNNNLVKDHFFNSIYRTQLPDGHRVVTFSCDNPFTASEYALMSSALTGIAATVVFTNGVHVLTFTFPALRATPVAPAGPAKGQELPLRLQFTARATTGAIPGEVQIGLVLS